MSDEEIQKAFQELMEKARRRQAMVDDYWRRHPQEKIAFDKIRGQIERLKILVGVDLTLDPPHSLGM